MRVSALINLNNIIENYKNINALLSEKTEFMAVVKANAYGHGDVQVATALNNAGCFNFAVATVDEAIKLRKNNVKGRILILGPTEPDRLCEVHDYDIVQSVASYDHALTAASTAPGIRMHLKIDTGMSRTGIYCHRSEDINNAVERAAEVYAVKGINVEGIFTHFAESGNLKSDNTEKQFTMFKSVIDGLTAKGIDVGTRHCCNSAGTLNYPEYHLDMARVGISLYGLPDGECRADIKLKPAMTFRSKIVQIEELKPGDDVGYSRTYTVKTPIKKAVVSAGYADGFNRLLSNKCEVLINGKRAKSIGRICMDLSMFDVTGIDCKVGDDVILFGEDKHVDEFADIIGTINYEVVCNVSARVPRIYI